MRVVKALPVIRWKLRPAQIYLGEPISSLQLCAVVARSEIFKGTLVYSPPLGTILPLGRHKLQVLNYYSHTQYISRCDHTHIIRFWTYLKMKEFICLNDIDLFYLSINYLRIA